MRLSKHILWVVGLIVLLVLPSSISQNTPKIPSGYCLSGEEHKLWTIINDYRKKKGLAAIPLSHSLSYVAHLHVRDLQDKVKTLTHGWSDCPYDASNAKTYPCMWEKPRKLTGYPGYGYECAHATYGSAATAEGALKSWQSSPPHHAVLINKDIWKNSTWNAMGVGIYKNYAVVWFGEQKDPQATPQICK